MAGGGNRPDLRATAAPDLRPPTLDFSDDEHGLIESLAPLLDGSPRGMKRFVNTLHLIKLAMTEQPPEALSAAMLLLGLASGGEGNSKLIHRIVEFAASSEDLPDDERTLGAAAGHARQAEKDDDPLASLSSWLDNEPKWQALPLRWIDAVVPIVARYSFQGEALRDMIG